MRQAPRGLGFRVQGTLQASMVEFLLASAFIERTLGPFRSQEETA